MFVILNCSYVRNFEMCVCNFEMCVCNFEKREMKYELHFQFWIMFLTLCSVVDFVCVVRPVGHRRFALGCKMYTNL